MKLSGSISGISAQLARLNKSIKRAHDLSPVLHRLSVVYMETIMTEAFKTEGASLGNPWSDQYTPGYKRWKTKKKGSHRPVLDLDGDLRRSLTKKGAKGNVVRIKQKGFDVGTSIPYAHLHNSGIAPQRERKFMVMPTQYVEKFENTIVRYISTGRVYYVP